MATPHALPGQIIDIQPLGERLAGEKTRALFKSDDLELMHLVLRAGQSLPPHQVPGDITIQCIEGRVEVEVDARATLLRAGQLLYLRGGALHAVTAVEASSVLVTVTLTR